MENKRDLLKEDETLDDLIIGNLQLIQPTHGYRFSIDAVLLAHFPNLAKVSRVVDLGTGSGVIPILLTGRKSEIRITGIEIQAAMADRARRSVCLNELENRIEIIQADIRDVKNTLTGGNAELVLSNPPFWKIGEGYISANREEAIARHEINLNLGELVEAGAYLLAQGGNMAIIQRAERLEELIEIFRRNRLFLHRLRLIHSFADRSATLVMLEGRKNRPGNLSILPPLLIYAQPGEYSEEIKKYYREK